MKSLIIAFTMFAGASVVKLAYDVYDLFLRPEDCLAVEPVIGERGEEFVYKGHIPCPEAYR